MKNKKGAELTTQQIVVITILIASFSVILFLLFRLNLGEQTNTEICHNSVILKEKSIIGGSLNCRTSYVCISGGEKCEDIVPTKTISIDTTKDEEVVKGELMKAIADQMAECWWMFGEGKVDYLRIGDKSPLGKNVCAVCSIVKFDESIKEKVREISYQELITQGLLKPKDSSQTYLSYLYGVNSIEELYKKFGDTKVFEKDVTSKKEINFEGRYMVRTGFKTGALWDSFGAKDSVKIYPYFFSTDDMPSPTCDEFITKA